MFGWPVADIKQRKFFQFIDKPFLRAFGPLGNSGKAAYIRAVQGDDSVRFAKISIFQNNASGTAILIRQASYSDAVSCAAVSLFVASGISCTVSGIGSEGAKASSEVFSPGDISLADSSSGLAG